MKRIYQSKPINPKDLSNSNSNNKSFSNVAGEIKRPTSTRHNIKYTSTYNTNNNNKTPKSHHISSRKQGERKLKTPTSSSKNISRNNFNSYYDLFNISLVCDDDFTNRQIVRRKSVLDGLNVDFIQGSFLTVKSNKIHFLILVTLDRITENMKSTQKRMIIGPSEIKELLEKFNLQK